MSERFESLPEEKRKRIIEACMEEFAQNGYQNASTNAIVKNAGISKGILFHYFGSKKKLFLYTIEYVMNYFMERYSIDKENQPSDIFERIMWFGLWKFKMSAEQPLMSKMVVTAYANASAEIEKELTEIIMKVYNQYMPALMAGFDTSKFRKGVDPNKAIEVITIFFNGLSGKIMKMYKNNSAEELMAQVDKMMEDFTDYIEILKYGAYGE